MMRQTAPIGLLGDLPERLARAAASPEGLTYADLLDRLCHGLRAVGVPVWWALLGIETLHPVRSGEQHRWTDGAREIDESHREGMLQSEAYLRSPVKIIDDTGKPLRVNLTETDLDLPRLIELRSRGGTDYIIYPLPFVDDDRTAIASFATKAPGGFSDHDLEILDLAVAVIGPFAERLAVREVAINLLDTYVGRRSGQKVFHGLIDLGDLISLPAAILFADLGNYTSLSETLPGETTVRLLDAWFDILGEPIENHGGEILKFLGDGLLAIFPAAADGLIACREAFAAALEARARFNRLETKAGLPDADLTYAIGLNFGEVGYGNVGTRTRLDFTVIGPAVNLASRLQDLAKSLREPVLASEGFAARISGAFVSRGHHQLRHIAEPVEAFAPAGPG